MSNEKLNDRELSALEQSSGDDCDMASVRCVVRELRAHRQAALTSEEREALRHIAVEVGADCPIGNDGEPKEPHRTALAVLTRLTTEQP